MLCYVCRYVCTYVCMYACMYGCLYVCMAVAFWLKRNHQALESWMDYSVEQYTPGFQVVSRLDVDPSGALLEVAHHTHPEIARLAVGTQFRLETRKENMSINAVYRMLYSDDTSELKLHGEKQRRTKMFG